MMGVVGRPLVDLRARFAAINDPLTLLVGFFTHAPVGLQIYRADGHCLVVNDAFRALFGSEPPPEYNVLHDEIAAANGVLDQIRRAFAGETVELPPIWYDARELKQVKVEAGRRVAISATFFPLFDEDGRVGHVAISFRDMTAVMEERERIARLSSVKDEFLNIASHELRSPLTAVRASVQLAARKLEIDADTKAAIEALRRAQKQIDRMGRLVDELLDGARIERGHLELQRHRVDFREVVRSECDDSMDTERLTVILPDEPIPVSLDEGRIAEVIGNLIANAIRHGASNAPVEVRLERSENTARLSVRDYGRGIDEADLPRIFERFYRGKTTHGSGGLGLGLYIASEIAKLHGGSLVAQSAPGAGATFTLSLPVDEDH
jgi:signal transduction histidine kinase